MSSHFRFCIIISSASTQIRHKYVQHITAASGIFFDYAGKLKIKSGHLNVIMALDISHFKSHIDNINSTIKFAKNMCNHTLKLMECNNVFEPLEIRQDDIEKQFLSISHLLNPKSKRSWFGGIGSVMKTIFGTLNEDDAVNYNNAINSLLNNEKKLMSLTKQNILVTNSVISNYNNTINKINSNQNKLNEAIFNLTYSINNITSRNNDMQTQLNINSIINCLDISLMTLSFQLDDIINSILFSSQNILHPALITPLQLYRELLDNHRHIPNSLELPTKLDLSSIHIITNVSSIVCFFMNNKINFVLRIPLVYNKEYELFHNIPLPVPHDSVKPNTFSLIIPENKYIGMTKDKTHYCNFDNLDNCIIVSSGQYICEVSNIYTSDAQPICESELLSKVISELPKQCNFKIFNGEIDLWKKLNGNKWIFVQSTSSKISIDCSNSESIEETILGTGILTLPGLCTAYCKNTMLISSSDQFNITVNKNIITNFNLINDSCCNINKVNNIINNIPSVNLKNLDLDDLTLNKNMMAQTLFDTELDIPHIVQYGTHYSILSVIVFFIIILYSSYKLYIYCKSSSSRGISIITLQPPQSPLKKSSSTQTSFDPEESTSSPPAPTLRTLI